MSNEYLSQEEVDALLKGVSGEGEAPAEAPPAEGVQPYDLATQERAVRGRMPALETINERFVRMLYAGLVRFLRRAPVTTLAAIRTTRYGEFLRDLEMPTSLNVVHLKPLRGASLFVYEPSIVFAVVDCLFGGDGRFKARVARSEFTATEQRIVQKLLAIAMEAYAKSWQPVHPLTPEFVRSESSARLANVFTASEVVVVTSIKIELGAAAGSLHLAVPYAALEPLRQALASTVQADGIEPDRRWLELLKSQVQHAEVELAAQLARLSVPVKDILAMRVGDVLPLELPPRVVASVDGVPILECLYGTANGQYAIKVDRILASSQYAQGEAHV